jgi:hypothetical protein
MDIIVTTPKNKSQEASREADYCKKNGGGYYFRVFPVKRYPRNIKIGDKVFYIDNGYIRGFCLIDACGLNFSKTPYHNQILIFFLLDLAFSLVEVAQDGLQLEQPRPKER